MLQISSTMLNVQVIIDTTHAHSNYDVAHSIQVMCYASLLPYTGGTVLGSGMWISACYGTNSPKNVKSQEIL